MDTEHNQEQMNTMPPQVQEPIGQSPQLDPQGGQEDIGSLFRNAWNLFTKKFNSLLKLAIWAFVLQLVVGIITFLTVGSFALFTWGANIGIAGVGTMVLVFVALLVVYTLIYAWIQAAFILLFDSPEAEPDIKTLFQKSKSLILPVWASSILVAIIVLAGFVLFVIPGIIFSIWFMFTILVVVLEGKSATEAMKRSKNLVQGRWWEVFLRVLLLIVVVGIGTAIASGVFSIFGRFLENVLSSALTAFVVAPFTLAFQYLLYKWLKQTRTSF